DVDVRSMAGDGIVVEKGNVMAAVAGRLGLSSKDNGGSGLRVDGGAVTIWGTAGSVSFNGNGKHGVVVDGGTLVLNYDASFEIMTDGTGPITANYNAAAGIAILKTSSPGYQLDTLIRQVVAWGNQDGALIHAGTTVSLYGDAFVHNARDGVRITD